MEYDNFNRRIKKKRPERGRKSEYEKRRTHQEVQQIKKDLINFATTKWGKQWIHSILKIGRPFRMQRGIEYAKDDRRIENLRINKGQIFATVQGTSPTPYRVKINFDIIPDEAWKIIFDSLANKTINLINLLDGILPEEIANIFEENKYPLFPDATKSIKAECSCPDKAVPCKHIASVILYISKVLDYDPFILLKIRGKSKKEILIDLSLAQKSKSELMSTRSNVSVEKDENVKFSFNVPKISIQEISSEKAISENMKGFEDISFEEISFKFKKPGKIIETFENLGIPQNIDNPKAFETVLKKIYQTISSEFYKKSMKKEKS